MGIMIGGLNGVGKSTLGKALAQVLDSKFIDVEDLYFPERHDYTLSRTREEVSKLLLQKIKENNNFVFASVKGDYSEQIYPFFQYVIIIEVPRDVRLQRVRERSYQKFGSRMLPEGDLYESEERFFEFVASRPEDTVEKWAQLVGCPIIRVDGTQSIEESIRYIINEMVSFDRR